MWLVLGITVGTIAAVRRNSAADRVSLGVSMLLLSAPPFWLALVFLWLFWFKLGIAPGSGYYSIGSYGFGSWLSHMIMPWLVLALLYAAWYARMTRGAVLDVLNRDFVLTARGKGSDRASRSVRTRATGRVDADVDDGGHGYCRPDQRSRRG